MLGHEMAWYQQLSGEASSLRRKLAQSEPVKMMGGFKARVAPEVGGDNSPRASDLSESPSQWRAYDFADAMEMGLSPSSSSNHLLPPRVDEEVRLRVQRTQDRKRFVLSSGEGVPFLMAKVREDASNEVEFDIFVAGEGDPPAALGPAFRLRPLDAARECWTLESKRCEECDARGKRSCGVRELGRFTHYTEVVGKGHAFCMDVELPALKKNGQADVWCTRCGDGLKEKRCAVLGTRRPKWNPRRQDLQLDFRGRCSMASAKNFQLEDPSSPKKVRLLFGKVGDHQFVLDYAAPLSAAQAFAATLTTANWG